jgi:hypothetical protein
MAKKHDADRNSGIREYLTWEERFVALLPIRFWRTGSVSGDLSAIILPADAEVERGQPILVENETQLRDLYEALLKVGLAPKVHNAIMKELGRSQRAERMRYEHSRTLAIRARINERKIRMRKNNERPRGGVHEAALVEEAEELGMTVAALKGRLRKKRLHP